MRHIRITTISLAGSLLAFAGTLLSHGPAVAQPKDKPDQERIVGTWCFSGDEKAPQPGKDLFRLTFAKDGTISVTISEEKGRYKVPAQGQIDITLPGQKQTALGLIKFKGPDKLIICLSGDPQKRPTEIDAKNGQGLIHLQRAKPGEENLTAEQKAQLQEAGDRTGLLNNLSHIAVAFLAYHDAKMQFPMHAIYSKDGKTPLLSWRVAILPYIEQAALYKEFKLNEAWDSPHNKKLIDRMPAVFEARGSGKKGEGKTRIQVFTGPDTLFDGPKQTTLRDIKDGTSLTILLIEARDPVIWTKPDDLVLPKAGEKLPAVGGQFKGVTCVAFCDRSVRSLPADIAPDVLRALITPRGKEVIDFEKLNR